MSKYRVPVTITTCASHTIGYVECDTVKEFGKKAQDLWESKDYGSPSVNITNDFDLGDWDINNIDGEDLKYYKAI